MDLKLLHAFLNLAAQGHFGRAADALLVTQPALTQRIQALERYVGVKLFTRTTREVRLTAAGEILLPYARTLAQVEEHALRDLAEHAAGRGGRLRLSYLSQGDMPTQSKIGAEFRHRYARASLETFTGNSQDNMARLVAGDVDAVFVATPINAPATVVVRTIAPYPLILGLPSSHRLAQLDRVPVKALRGEPLIIAPPSINAALITALRAWLTRHTGAKLNVVAEEPPDHAVEAISSLGAMAFLSGRLSVAMTPPPGVAFRPMSPTPLVALAMAYRRDDPAPLLTNLLRVVDEVAPVDPRDITEDSEPI